MNRTSLLSAAFLSASFFLAGCGGFNGASDIELNAEQRHPITVQSDMATLNISTMDEEGLSGADRQAIAAFSAGYKEHGHGPLTIATPSGSRQGNQAVNMLVEVRDMLAEQGIAGNSVNFVPYDVSAPDAEAPIILSYKRFIAKASPCGDWSTDYAYDPSNGTPPNFGCASQNNLAAMIAEPADLVTMRNMTPADAQRRSIVFDKYRKGEITATAREANDSGAVSEVNK